MAVLLGSLSHGGFSIRPFSDPMGDRTVSQRVNPFIVLLDQFFRLVRRHFMRGVMSLPDFDDQRVVSRW
jgi:hypothetical protein